MASFFLFLRLFSFSSGQSLFTDSLHGYQLYLPANWTSESTDSLEVNFWDATLGTGINQGLGIFLFELTPAEKQNPEEWVREQYIANKDEIDSAQEYLPVLLFTDSSHTLRINGRWGPDICAFFYDDLEDYKSIEYVTYTHANGYGIELFAFGDSLIMTQNLFTYMGMLRSVQFFFPKIAAVKRPEGEFPLKFRRKDLKQGFYGPAYDIRGRILPNQTGLSIIPHVIILKEAKKKLLILP